MYKEHKRVREGMNIGRGLSVISKGSKSSGKGFLFGVLLFAGMIALVILCKKFGLM